MTSSNIIQMMTYQRADTRFSKSDGEMANSYRMKV